MTHVVFYVLGLIGNRSGKESQHEHRSLCLYAPLRRSVLFIVPMTNETLSLKGFGSQGKDTVLGHVHVHR